MRSPSRCSRPRPRPTSGHDVNIDLDERREDRRRRAGPRRPGALPGSLRARGEKLAANGLILADTKFELGFVDGELVVCDEVITPDSSRIWPADEVRLRRGAAVFRQAAVPRLADRDDVGPDTAAAAGSRRRRGDDVVSLRRVVRTRDRDTRWRMVRCFAVNYSVDRRRHAAQGHRRSRRLHHRARPSGPRIHRRDRTCKAGKSFRIDDRGRRPRPRRSKRPRRWPNDCSRTP